MSALTSQWTWGESIHYIIFYLALFCGSDLHKSESMNSIAQQLEIKLWAIADALFRISSMTIPHRGSKEQGQYIINLGVGEGRWEKARGLRVWGVSVWSSVRYVCVCFQQNAKRRRPRKKHVTLKLWWEKEPWKWKCVENVVVYLQQNVILVFFSSWASEFIRTSLFACWLLRPENIFCKTVFHISSSQSFQNLC